MRLALLPKSCKLELPKVLSEKSLHSVLGSALWATTATPLAHQLTEILVSLKSIYERIEADKSTYKQEDAKVQDLLGMYARWLKHFKREGSTTTYVYALPMHAECILFTDAAFVQDRSKAKCTGQIFIFGENGEPVYISSFSRKSQRTCQSPLGAELLSVIDGVNFLEHIQEIYRQFHGMLVINTICMDNYGILSHASKNHSKVQRGLVSKAYYYIKGKSKELDFTICHTAGKGNPADVGTKSSCDLDSWYNLSKMVIGIWPSIMIECPGKVRRFLGTVKRIYYGLAV